MGSFGKNRARARSQLCAPGTISIALAEKLIWAPSANFGIVKVMLATVLDAAVAVKVAGKEREEG